ncbi:hypothetical protein DL96DRAFT_1608529 [Flagelloscypha sp. PMI_526]|nr:hypothetical protein DL96DRAFT_1608529 [Flagelloscypha sp. PMI_526]
MKIIVTGATGRVGSSALRHCLASPQVTAVVVLSRRALPFESSLPPDQRAKLQTLILQPNEFLAYPAHVMDALIGAEACIWSLGVPIRQSAEATWTVEVDYATYAAKTCKEHLAVKGGRVFRFLLMSADEITEETQNWWYKADYRNLKGEALKSILSLEDEKATTFKTFAIRMALVVMPDSWLNNWLTLSLSFTIAAPILAAAIFNVATGAVVPKQRAPRHAELAALAGGSTGWVSARL